MFGLRLILVLSLVAASVPALAAPPPQLFGAVSATSRSSQAPRANLPNKAASIQSRWVHVNRNVLRQSIGESIVFNFFSNASVKLTLEEVDPSRTGHEVFIGRGAGGTATLVMKNDRLVGNVWIGKRLFHIRSNPAGDQWVSEVRPAALPEEGPPVVAAVPAKTIEPLAISPSDSGSIIDVMVVYTAAARALSTDIEADILVAVAETNETFRNSGITPRIRLVHMREVTYTESGTLSTDLERLQITNDGHMDGVHTLRDTHRADLVSLWTASGGGYCGRGYLMETVSSGFDSHAFSIVAHQCAMENLSFAHELGHNMGARHDWDVDDEDNSPYAYNHGYTYPAGAWRTVMAYDTACEDVGVDCTRVPFWSNPDRQFDGVAMGRSLTSNEPTDNRRTLNNTASTVANFRYGGSVVGNQLGWAVATGDFNGDGHKDLAISGPGKSPEPNSGAVYIYRGTAGALIHQTTLTQEPHGANEQGDRFGEALAVGDFNGDGFDDLAVGTPRESPGNDPRSGYVFTFRGTSTGLTAWAGVSQTALDVNEENDRFGASLAAGDFDNDGRDDLAVGAPQESIGSLALAGRVYTFRGVATGLSPWQALSQSGIGVNEQGDRFGTALSSGDYNGDGRADLAVAAPFENPGSASMSGYVFVFRGAATGLNAWAGLSQSGLDANEPGDQFGAALTSGDIDGDGRAELVVGAPGESGAAGLPHGRVYIFRGSPGAPAPWRTLGQTGLGVDEQNDAFGASLAAGDINNDGRADLAVGAPGEAPGSEGRSGYVYLFRGAATGPVAWVGLDQGVLGANEDGDRFGSALATGDFNNDGRADLAVGAPYEAPSAEPNGGYGFIFRGTQSGASAFQGIDASALP